MNWYMGYQNSADGIVFLDENGFDRIAIGTNVLDPNIGKRIGKENGITINDEKGFERSGYGLLPVNNQNRVVLGLDGKDGREGVSLLILEDGTTGLWIKDKNNSSFLGKTDTANYINPKARMHGLIIKDRDSIKHIINSFEKSMCNFYPCLLSICKPRNWQINFKTYF